MGYWTWIERHDAAKADVVRAGREKLVPKSETHTHRAWHAIHVALTGEEETGASPAAWVVGFGRGASRIGFADVSFVHDPGTVRAIADHLRTVDFTRALETLRTAIEGGAYVYSIDTWDDAEITTVFDRVCALYLDAADAGDLVYVHRC